ncbi:Deshydrogenase mokE [Colletotrichum fructicola]|nr:Deshydrogenase mokE [Colletotrichum fructicola]
MQLLRLAGLISIGLCSPKHFDLSRKNGAQDVFDRFDKDVAQKIVNGLYRSSLRHPNRLLRLIALRN